MSIMVTSPAEGKRRFRDQTLAMNINASSEPDELASIKRRQTIGGDARPRSSSAVDLAATVLPTPTKHKVNLGSTAASAYYFSGIPKTPLSSAKSPSNAGGTDSGKAPQTTSSDGDDSTPSTGASDIMNKSVLSDTTELTASNFVRVASSRMQVTGLQKFMSEYSLQSELLAQSAIQSQTQDSLDYAYTAASTVSSHGKVSTSPSTLRKFTRTLKQSRLSTDEEFEGPSKRSNNESSIAPSFVSPITKGSDDQTQKQSSSRDLDVSLASLDDLFDGLMSATRMESSPERSLLASPQSDTDRSPFLEATESTNEVDKKPRSSFLSPGVSPIDRDHAYEAPFRLTPCKTSTTLTPTKLNPSPRRVLNLNVADSPARNTRSASKSAPSDQLGLSNETVGPGESLIHGSPSRFVTTSNPKQVLEMDDEGSSGNRPGVFTKYSSAIEDSKRRRAESEAEAYYPSGPGKKRKGGDFGDEGLPIAGSSTLRESKSECASVPKSILNSTKKKQNAPEYLRRKSVAFGSPEAAEYHIGSPSVSLTPMPSNRAKAMFSIPSASSNADSNSSVASVSINSTIIDEESKTIDIEVDVNQMLENAAEFIESASRKVVLVDASGASSPLWESNELTVSPSADMSIDIASDQMNIEDATTTVVPHSFLSHERTADGLDSGLLKSSSTSDRAYDRVIGTPASESIVSTKTLAGNASTDLIEGKDSEDAWRAVQSAVSSARQSSELYTDDDNTVELEADMSAILAMVSQGSDDYDSLPALKLADRFPKTTSALVPTTLRMSFGHSVPTHLRGDLTPSRFDYGLSESPVTLSARSCRRRSDSSRRRFSLARTGRLSTASEGSLLDLSRSNCVIGVDETEPDSHLEVDGIEEIVEEFTISCKEIKQLIGPGGCLATKNLNGGFQSSVQSLCERENARYSQVSNSILSFALAVCGEVEEKAQLNSDSEACFFDLVESIEDEKFRLQRWIRNEHGRNETKSIAVAIRRIVDHEWSGWEKIVLESLTTAIAQIGAEMEPECCQLEDCTTALYHLHDLLSISAGKAARRARRRSMARHENNGIHLTRYVDELEKKISELDVQASHFLDLLGDATSIKAATGRRILTQDALYNAKAAAENSHRNLVSVKGLSRVAPLSVTTATVTLRHIGCCPSSCLTSSFSFLGGSSVQCSSLCLDCALISKGKREKLSSHASMFVKSRCSLLSSVFSDKELAAAEEMRCLVRQLEWTRGRIESTAQELTALEKRFKLSLATDREGGVSEFLVHVTFEGTVQNYDLVTTFELNASYPFGPLNVSLEPGHSEMNLGHLQKHLTKNVKPGFGYLSRACDVIAAVMQSAFE